MVQKKFENFKECRLKYRIGTSKIGRGKKKEKGKKKGAKMVSKKLYNPK